MLQLVADVRFDAVEALLDDLDHFWGALDLVAGIRHSSSDFVRVVVAEGFLDRLEIDHKSSPGVPVQGHGVEDEGMTLVWGAQLDDDCLWLA
jgi:hypothetical protein